MVYRYMKVIFNFILLNLFNDEFQCRRMATKPFEKSTLFLLTLPEDEQERQLIICGRKQICWNCKKSYLLINSILVNKLHLWTILCPTYTTIEYMIFPDSPSLNILWAIFK